MPVFSRFLPYFLAVARHGSIRKASEELGIAASAIDRQVQQAERALRCRLFERLPTGMRLTAAGELLLRRARDWSDELDALRAGIDDLRGLRRGAVRLAAIDALARGRLAAAAAALMREHPLLSVQIAVMDNKDVAGAVASGAADLGLLLEPRPSRDLAIRELGAFPIGFVLPPDHRLAGRSSVPPSAGAEERLIAPAAPLALHRRVAAIEALSGVSFNRVATADSIHMIGSLVRAGAGIGILCALDVLDEVGRGELAFVPIGGAGLPPLVLGLCSARARPLTGPAQLAIGYLERHLGAG